ncbi:Gm39566 [Phodopus roborovskii]|uniref:Gm39566 protein n=1 Tax=Phodopus roborovskii TaxID=109678 RepID=A0AAU9Z297_PHORO|nr:Gm39566 [Phodopus roborovskii]
MGEQIYHRAQACSGTNLRKCQDLGDSILLILGSFILLNVGINVVTLLWKHLKNSLRILFHHFFPKDPKNLCSRMPSRFHHHPNFLLGHVNHLDSWIPDTNDENISRCCWMPPQCGHDKTPTDTPWELWKEGLMGAGEAPQATVMKIQAPLFSRPEISPQIPKISKLNRVPPPSYQKNKNKVPDDSSSHVPAQALTCSSTNTNELPSTQAQTQTSEPIQFSAQGLEHTSAHTPPVHASDFISAPIPALSEAPIPANAPPPTPSHNPASTPPYLPVQAPTHSQAHSLDQAQPHILPPIALQVPDPTQTQGLVHGPEQTSAHTLSQPPTQGPAHACFQCQDHDPAQVLVHTLTYPQVDVPEQTAPQASAHAPPCSLLPSHAHSPVSGPTSVPAPALALSMTMTTTQASAQVPVTTTTPTLPPVPAMLATFGPSLSTGHMVYDARRVKQNVFLKHNSQSSRCFRKDLNILSRPQEVKGLVNSGTSEQTQKPHGGDSVVPPAGSILGYLELGNMEWEISNNAKDKFSQPKTFPYCSFHPCCSESKNEDSHAPVYPKFLVYTQDATPSQPCFHSPSTAQSTLPTIPTPCTLALPLVSPRTFVVPQSNHQKSSNLTQTPTFLSTSKSPQTVSTTYFSSPSQFSTISQTLIQPLSPENPTLNQGFDLQKTPSLAKDSRVPRNPGLTQDPDFQKNPSLAQDPGLQKNLSLIQDPGIQKNLSLIQDPGLQKNLSLTQDPELQKNLSLIQDPGLQKIPGLAPNPEPQKDPSLAPNSELQKNPGLIPNPGLQKSPGLIPNPGLQKNPDLVPNPGLHKNPGLILNPCLHKNSGFYKFPVCTQDPYLCVNPNISQDPCPQKNLDITQDSGRRSSAAIQDAGVLRNLGLIQPSRLQKNIIFNQTSGQRTLSFMQDSVVFRNVALNQDTVINKNKDLSPVTDQKRLDPSQDSRNNGSRNAQHPGICRNVGLIQDSRSQKIPYYTQDSEINKNAELTQKSSSSQSPGLVQTSCFCKSSGLTQDSGDYKNLGFIQDPAIYRVPNLNQDTDSHKSPCLINVTTAEKRLNLNQDVGVYSSEHCQDPNLQECPAIDQDSGSHQNPALGQGSGFKTPGLTQQAGLNKKTSFVPGTASTQVLGPLQTLQLTSSSVKSCVCKTDNTEPVNQSTSPSKAQVLSPDLKSFSEVPVLIELQPSSPRLDSQEWAYHTANAAVSSCQKYRQMSMPPKINWRPRCPGPSTRAGHVVFDSRQKQLVTGREKCEALSPRRPCQEVFKNSEETQKEWGYQNVMRTLNKEGANTHQE